MIPDQDWAFEYITSQSKIRGKRKALRVIITSLAPTGYGKQQASIASKVSISVAAKRSEILASCLLACVLFWALCEKAYLSGSGFDNAQKYIPRHPSGPWATVFGP